MKRLLDLVENPKIAQHLPTALWLTSPKNKGEGRTTCLSIAFILNAIRNPGIRLSYYDHHNDNRNEKEIIRRRMEGLCDYVCIDRQTVVCNRSAKILPGIPDYQVKETVIDLVRSAAKLAKENEINIEELIDVVRQEMIADVIEC